METNLLTSAENVLIKNNRGKWTVPAGDLYPHQWLWDSCFIAIGLRHIDVERAQTELRSLVRGQWRNGMLPHIIFSEHTKKRWQQRHEEASMSPYAPSGMTTSGITQPPMLAEAIVQIGHKLSELSRHKWYSEMYPHLLRHHQWLYADRDPHEEGLIVLLHPYESGLDNSPPWISELHTHRPLWWLRLLEITKLDSIASLLRRDTRHVDVGQRISNSDAIAYLAATLRLRRKKYNSQVILSRALFAVEDLAFNCIFVRANRHLREIAEAIGRRLPDALVERMQKTEHALETLWDEETGQYYSRSFVNHKLIKEPTVATFLPFYAGEMDKHKAARLIRLLNSDKHFGLKWPVPSVPRDSNYFNRIKYWQGPTWVNINWIIIDGLRRNGYEKEAQELKQRTIEMLETHGIGEYYDPLNGQALGAKDFSWTAALAIDLLKN